MGKCHTFYFLVFSCCWLLLSFLMLVYGYIFLSHVLFTLKIKYRNWIWLFKCQSFDPDARQCYNEINGLYKKHLSIMIEKNFEYCGVRGVYWKNSVDVWCVGWWRIDQLFLSSSPHPLPPPQPQPTTINLLSLFSYCYFFPSLMFCYFFLKKPKEKSLRWRGVGGSGGGGNYYKKILLVMISSGPRNSPVIKKTSSITERKKYTSSFHNKQIWFFA